MAPVLGADAGLLEAAALHDIGYAPGLAATGLHALDGARYLRDAGHADSMLCRLVAHHSCALFLLAGAILTLLGVMLGSSVVLLPGVVPLLHGIGASGCTSADQLAG